MKMVFKAWHIALVMLLAYALLGLLHLHLDGGFLPWHMDAPFADLIALSSASDAFGQGRDPYLSTQSDPWGRLFNYPLLWLRIVREAGLHRGNEIPYALGLIFLFTLAFSGLFQTCRGKDFVYLFLFMFSPAVLLLMERCNSDLFIGLLLITALFYVRKQRSSVYGILLSAILIVLAAMLKLYPGVLLLLLLLEKDQVRMSRVFFALALVFLLFWFYTHRAEWLMVWKNVPRPQHLAYGRTILFARLLPEFTAGLLSQFLYFGCLFLAWGISGRTKSMFQKADFKHEQIRLFLAGALLYAWTFYLGSNYLYRLVFLGFCLPLLFSLRQNGNVFSSLLLWLILARIWFDAITLLLPHSLWLSLSGWMLSWSLLFFLMWILFVLVRSLYADRQHAAGLKPMIPRL